MDGRTPQTRGTRALLAELEAAGRVADARRPARERLAELVGAELADLLVGALSGDKAPGPAAARLVA